jgi:chaperonin GroEL
MMQEAGPYLGSVKKITVDANNSLFIPVSNKSAEARADFLDKFAEAENNMYIKERLVKRISQLRGKIAVLKISGQDFEREYLKDKADDAIKASKVALQEGVVEGGGMCLWRIAQDMKPKSVGEEILRKALIAPLKQNIENAGLDYAEITNGFIGGVGYDTRKNAYVDMVEYGIIDPAKVERCAVENAVANAAQFITGHCSVTEYVEPKD